MTFATSGWRTCTMARQSAQLAQCAGCLVCHALRSPDGYVEKLQARSAVRRGETQQPAHGSHGSLVGVDAGHVTIPLLSSLPGFITSSKGDVSCKCLLVVALRRLSCPRGGHDGKKQSNHSSVKKSKIRPSFHSDNASVSALRAIHRGVEITLPERSASRWSPSKWHLPQPHLAGGSSWLSHWQFFLAFFAAPSGAISSFNFFRIPMISAACVNVHLGHYQVSCHRFLRV